MPRPSCPRVSAPRASPTSPARPTRSRIYPRGRRAALDFGGRYILELAFGADPDRLFAAMGGLRIDLGTASSGQSQAWFEVVPPADSAQCVVSGLHPLPGGRTLVVATETFWNISPREAELWYFTIRK